MKRTNYENIEPTCPNCRRICRLNRTSGLKTSMTGAGSRFNARNVEGNSG